MANRYVLVFAESVAAGNAYARRVGLQRGRYRAVAHAASIRGIQSADVHILPCFEKRRDKHAMLAAIRHGFNVNQIRIPNEETEHAVIGPPRETPGAGDAMPKRKAPGAGTDEKKMPRKHKSVDPVVKFVPILSDDEDL